MKKLVLISLLFPIVAFCKLRVAVLDAGISPNINSPKFCKDYFEDFTEEGLNDPSGHGTNVVGLIIETAPKDADYCIKVYKAFSKKSMDSNYVEALKKIFKDGPDILNISAGGTTVIPEERALIKKMLDNGVIIVVAAGNERANLSSECIYFPACLDKRIIVVANGKNGIPAKSSNINGPVSMMVDGQQKTGFGITLSGTSQSTAIATGLILKDIYLKSKNHAN